MNVTLIGGPMHRRTVAVPKGVPREIKFPVLPHSCAWLEGHPSEEPYLRIEEDRYELKRIEIHGVEIAVVGLHYTCLSPAVPRLR